MGLLSGAAKLIGRGGDEAADAVKAGDDVADAATDARRGIDYSDDPFRKRVMADAAGRAFEQPARMTDAAARNASSTVETVAKSGSTAVIAGVGIPSTAYVGDSALQTFGQWQQQESQEFGWEEYLAARESIKNNENLSPEEREQRLERLAEKYSQFAEETGDSDEDASTIGAMGLIKEEFAEAMPKPIAGIIGSLTPMQFGVIGVVWLATVAIIVRRYA